MAAAAAKMLGTYELLEAILVDLSARELFVLQRVDYTWHEVIGRSETLQKKMLLAPSGDVIHPTGSDGNDLPEHDTSDLHFSPALLVPNPDL